MELEVYFKKVYTAAYRLTGKEEIAAEIAELSITNTMKQLGEDYKVTTSMFQLTILELIQIFFEMPKSHLYDDLIGIQKALLKLKPVNRAVVIWKDVLGYQISENIPVLNCTHEVLVRELACGRKELKEEHAVIIVEKE